MTSLRINELVSTKVKRLTKEYEKRKAMAITRRVIKEHQDENHVHVRTGIS